MSSLVKIQRLNSKDSEFRETLLSSLSLPMADDQAIDAAVVNILAAVKEKGDEAVLSFTKQFDRLGVASISELEIPSKDLEQAYNSLSAEQKNALDIAAKRVRAYHEKQKIEAGCHSWEYEEADGTRLGQKVTPLDRVGI
jgi:histidinol dehydrogenase